MADIALGSIPLVTKAFTACLAGYKLFTQAQQLGQDSQVLLWKFRIQEMRLKLWGREWGLLADGQLSADMAMRIEEDRKLVLEGLERISEILEDYNKIKSRYGLRLVTDDPRFTMEVSASPRS